MPSRYSLFSKPQKTKIDVVSLIYPIRFSLNGGISYASPFEATRKDEIIKYYQALLEGAPSIETTDALNAELQSVDAFRKGARVFTTSKGERIFRDTRAKGGIFYVGVALSSDEVYALASREKVSTKGFMTYIERQSQHHVEVQGTYPCVLTVNGIVRMLFAGDHVVSPITMDVSYDLKKADIGYGCECQQATIPDDRHYAPDGTQVAPSKNRGWPYNKCWPKRDYAQNLAVKILETQKLVLPGVR